MNNTIPKTLYLIVGANENACFSSTDEEDRDKTLDRLQKTFPEDLYQAAETTIQVPNPERKYIVRLLADSVFCLAIFNSETKHWVWPRGSKVKSRIAEYWELPDQTIGEKGAGKIGNPTD